MEADRYYCDFCGRFIPKNDDGQIWFMVDNYKRHYCSGCVSYVEKVRKLVKRKVDYCKLNNQSYDIKYVFKIVESLFKDKNGDMKVSFPNNFNYSEDIIGKPISKDNIPIGYIFDVNEEK